MIKNPSHLQIAICDAMQSSSRNLIVRAGAGSGKTTTGVELAQISKAQDRSHIFLAFNKSIAAELRSRNVNGRTFHSLCMQPVLRARNARDVSAEKLRCMVDEEMQFEDVKLYGAFIVKLVKLAKNAGIGALVDDVEQVWDELAAKHDLELESEKADWATAISFARRLLKGSNADPRVDWDDVLYFAVRDGIVLPKFDDILVDEAQDTNAIQRAILRKIMKPGSRIIAVGDPSQAIYGFRGADSDSMDLLAAEFDAQWMPLTISYRCAKSIVEFAKQFGEIEAAPGAVDGEVKPLPRKDVVGYAVAGDLVVSRCTKPLIELAYEFLKARKPAYVMGRDIGQGLVSLINKMNAKGIANLEHKLTEWTAKEVEKAIAKKQEARAEAIQDKTDCVLFLIDTLQETNKTVPALINVINELFSDKAGAVVLATIHKAKGLEAERVIWLNFDYKSSFARQDWQKQQEKNLQYVAATRAKLELALVPSPPKQTQRGEM
jgi:superfamily I DNA/RNA helicase